MCREKDGNCKKCKTKALFAKRQGGPTARLTLARGLKDSPSLRAKIPVQLTPVTLQLPCE